MNIPTKNSDPSGLVGGLGAVASAIFGALVVFGQLTPEQSEALLRVVVTAGPFIIGGVAWAIRRWAWAPDTVDRRVQQVLRLERSGGVGER